MRMIPYISDLLMPLEETIQCKLLLLLTGHENITNVEHNLLACPSMWPRCMVWDSSIPLRFQMSSTTTLTCGITSSLGDFIMEMKYEIPPARAKLKS
jgi:hypothetical protein